MIETLDWIFHGFWRFAGVTLWLCIIAAMVVGSAQALKKD